MKKILSKRLIIVSIITAIILICTIVCSIYFAVKVDVMDTINSLFFVEDITVYVNGSIGESITLSSDDVKKIINDNLSGVVFKNALSNTNKCFIVSLMCGNNSMTINGIDVNVNGTWYKAKTDNVIKIKNELENLAKIQANKN